MNPRAHRDALPTSTPPIAGPEPDLPTHSEDGVDLTLIRWMLSLSPGERLASLEGILDLELSIRGARD